MTGARLFSFTLVTVSSRIYDVAPAPQLTPGKPLKRLGFWLCVVTAHDHVGAATGGAEKPPGKTAERGLRRASRKQLARVELRMRAAAWHTADDNETAVAKDHVVKCHALTSYVTARRRRNECSAHCTRCSMSSCSSARRAH